MKQLWICLALLSFSACATTPPAPPPPEKEGEVAMDEKPAMERKEDQGPVDYSKMSVVFPEQPVSQELPVYPEMALADEVGCKAELLVHVLTDGSVKIVTMTWLQEPSSYRDEFEASIREVISSWVFEPAHRFVPRRREDGTVAGGVVPVPKARRVFFSFEVIDGQGRVE